jgi:hypothetical protein
LWGRSVTASMSDFFTRRVVTEEEARAYLKEHGFVDYLETSAKDCTNVHELFAETAKRILEKHDQKASVTQEEPVSIEKPADKTKGCCGK